MMRTVVIGVIVSILAVTSVHAQSVTPRTFREITKIQKLVEEQRHDEAIVRLEALVEKSRGNPYDFAIANQYLAHSSVMTDDIPRARRALKEALATGELPDDVAAELKIFYGSVLLGDEEYALARTILEEWIAVAAEPRPKQIFQVAYANYMSGDLPRAEELITRAIDGLDERAPDSWFHIRYRILFDAKKFSQARNALYRLIARDPAKELSWRMLASHYLQLDQNGEALAAVMLSYHLGLDKDADALKQIVHLYSFIEVPDKAARLLEEFIRDGRIESDADTKKQLGNLWLLARERAKAKVALSEAARAAPDGKTFAMLGGIHFEDEDWKAAYDAYRQALRLGGLDEPRRISLLAGITAFRAGLYDEARHALRDAAESPDYRKQARSLLRKINELDKEDAGT